MEARTVVWYSIVAVGMALQSLTPAMLFGLDSWGMFFAALAYDFIGIGGIGFFYAFYFVRSIPMVSMDYNFATTFQDSLISMAQEQLKRKTWTPAQLQQIAPTINFIQGPIMFNILFVFMVATTYVVPMVWFAGSRRILKKLHMRERIGVLR